MLSPLVIFQYKDSTLFLAAYVSALFLEMRRFKQARVKLLKFIMLGVGDALQAM